MQKTYNKEIDDLIKNNEMFLIMIGYAKSIIDALQNRVVLTDKEIQQINWYNQAINNVIYQKIPPPPIP